MKKDKNKMTARYISLVVLGIVLAVGSVVVKRGKFDECTKTKTDSTCEQEAEDAVKG